MGRLLKCLWCSGTGWDSPPREDRQKCRQCGGEGELPEDHQWAGYCASYDFRRGHTSPARREAA